jgi:LEA14-like dessication related protein
MRRNERDSRAYFKGLMRKLTVLVTGVLAAGALGCATLGIGAFKEPVVSLKDVSVRRVGLSGGSVDIVLSVYNPNGYRLNATRMTYKLMVDTVPFGSGALDSNFTVQKDDSTRVTLPLDFTWGGVGTLGRQLLSTGTVGYRVTGDITVGSPVGNFTLPYDRTGRFSAFGGTR